MSVKRYTNWCWASHGHELQESNTGPWVLASDHDAKVEELEKRWREEEARYVKAVDAQDALIRQIAVMAEALKKMDSLTYSFDSRARMEKIRTDALTNLPERAKLLMAVLEEAKNVIAYEDGKDHEYFPIDRLREAVRAYQSARWE